MATKKPGPRYSKEVFAKMADKMYKLHVEPILKARDKGKFVAIDIETGEFEMHTDQLTAVERLWGRLPDPQPFMYRIGYPSLTKFGGRRHGGVT